MLPSAPVDKRSGKAKWMAWWNQYFHLQANFVFRDDDCQTHYGCICGVTLHFHLWNLIKGFNHLLKIIKILLFFLRSPLFLNLWAWLYSQTSLLNVILCFLLLSTLSLFPLSLFHCILQPPFYTYRRFLAAYCIVWYFLSPFNLLNNLLNDCSPAAEFSMHICSLDSRK